MFLISARCSIVNLNFRENINFYLFSRIMFLFIFKDKIQKTREKQLLIKKELTESKNLFSKKESCPRRRSADIHWIIYTSFFGRIPYFCTTYIVIPQGLPKLFYYYYSFKAFGCRSLKCARPEHVPISIVFVWWGSVVGGDSITLLVFNFVG